MYIDLILLKKAPAECQEFERKMVDIEKNAHQDENIDTYQLESLFNIMKNFKHMYF